MNEEKRVFQVEVLFSVKLGDQRNKMPDMEESFLSCLSTSFSVIALAAGFLFKFPLVDVPLFLVLNFFFFPVFKFGFENYSPGGLHSFPSVLNEQIRDNCWRDYLSIGLVSASSSRMVPPPETIYSYVSFCLFTTKAPSN